MSPNAESGHTDLRKPLQRETVGSIGYRELVSLDIDATLAAAVRLMQEKAIGCVVVVDGEALRGIFTERDLVMRVLGQVDSLEAPLRDYMTPDPKCLKANRFVSEALDPMVKGSYRHLPIQGEDGEFVGVLTIHNLFTFLAELMPVQLLNLPPRPHQQMPSAEGA